MGDREAAGGEVRDMTLSYDGSPRRGLRPALRPTVVLFDVDGTLVTTPGCGRRALERAFAARYGSSTVLRDVRLDGMTDRGIARAGLAALGEPATGPAAEAAIDALLATYLPLLEEETAAPPATAAPRGAADRLHAPAAAAPT